MPEIKSYTKKELERLYGVSRTTFRKWLKPILHTLPDYTVNQTIFTPRQVAIIFKHLNAPNEE